MAPDDVLATLRRVKAVPVIRAGTLEPAMQAARWLGGMGLPVVEMTLTTPNVFAGIAELSREPGLVVGAGTILSAPDARLAIAAGCQFIVTPCWVDGVIELARAANIAVLIGAATAGEIWRAHSAGASAVKVFPAASLGGPTFLSQLRAVFPAVPLMPTGGVTIDTAADYLAAGALCVGLGSELVPAKSLAAGDRAAVADRVRRLLARLAPSATMAV